MTNQIELQNINATKKTDDTAISHDTEMKQLDEMWIADAQTQDFIENNDDIESVNDSSDDSEDDGKYSQRISV